MSLPGDLERLMGMSLHDMPVTSLTIDFQNRGLELELAAYDERTHDYDPFSLVFQGIKQLNLGEMVLGNHEFDDLEVSSHSVTQVDGECTIRLLLLTGFGRPSVELSFAFKQVFITRKPTIR